MMLGRLLSYWEGNFSGAMLNFGRVNMREKKHAIIHSATFFALPFKISKKHRAYWNATGFRFPHSKDDSLWLTWWSKFQISLSFKHYKYIFIYLLKYDICIPGTPNKQFEMDIGISNHLCNFLWSHPTETTIKKWMSQVPGIYGIYPPEN